MPRLDFIRKQRWPGNVEQRLGLVTPARAIIARDAKGAVTFDGIRAGEEIYRMSGGREVYFEEEEEAPENEF
jgi:hypothetical protein